MIVVYAHRDQSNSETTDFQTMKISVILSIISYDTVKHINIKSGVYRLHTELQSKVTINNSINK